MSQYISLQQLLVKLLIFKLISTICWRISTNFIKLGLDLRNELTVTSFGDVCYVVYTEVKEAATNAKQANCIQKSVPTNPNQEYSSLANPLNVDIYVRFSEVALVCGAVAPCDTQL